MSSPQATMSWQSSQLVGALGRAIIRVRTLDDLIYPARASLLPSLLLPLTPNNLLNSYSFLIIISSIDTPYTSK